MTTLASTLATITLFASLQTAQAASELIGKRVQNTYDTTLYLDPEKALAYAMKDWKFLRYNYNDNKPKISYAMDTAATTPKSTPEEPVMMQWDVISQKELAKMNLSEEEQCYQVFTKALGDLLYYAVHTNNLERRQYFHMDNVITADSKKVPGPPGVILCAIPDHGSISMYLQGQLKAK
ncbi:MULTISPECIES: hypothetical protein [unclassified Pseudomonas]|uniref:hypothetical protein n=1 Tax=unclassified Pseudomonas TaxID=196821 RepID=UPI0011145926|nr:MULTISPECIES: hypothetical protein [unclassified Pseudomonas]